MKKIWPLLLVCLTLGGLIPYLTAYHPKQLLYLLLVLSIAVVILWFKKGKISVYDCLIIYMALIPFHTFRIGTERYFVRLTELAFIPLFFWWLAQKAAFTDESKRIFPSEYILLSAFLMFTVMSISKSIKPAVSIHRTLILSYLVIFSFIVADILRNKSRLINVIKAMMVISSVAAVVSVFQSFFPRLHPFSNLPLVSMGKINIYRAGAGWHDPSYYALYLAMIIPITLNCIMSKQFREIKFLRVCLILQLAGLISSYSRAATIATFFAFLFLLWTYKKRRLALGLLIIVSVVILTLSLGIDYIYTHQPYIAAYVFRITNLELLKEHPALVAGHRLDAWKASAAMFWDNPILGVGPFMSSDMYLRYRPEQEIWSLDRWLAVHSEYLSLLSERGLLGFLSFTAFLIVLLGRAGRGLISFKQSQLGAIMLGLLAGVISFLVFSLAAASIYTVQFWLTVGLIIGVYYLIQKEKLSMTG